MMKNKFVEIWDILSSEQGPQDGFYSRRFSELIYPNVFVSLKKPENLYSFFLLFDSLPELKMSSFKSLNEIQVTCDNRLEGSNERMLAFTLNNRNYKEIFSILALDLVLSIKDEKSQSQVFNTIIERFDKWRDLFSKVHIGGLSQEQQRGLYGELFLLKELLTNNSNYDYFITAWQGPNKKEWDFQNEGWGIEVKTSISKHHQKIHISNEKQLDNTNLEDLYLYFICVDELINSGETLNGIIYDIEEILKDDFEVLTIFKSKLYQSGYFSFEHDLYEETGYKVKEIKNYSVISEFPRIIAKDLMPGVGDVKYSIMVDCLEPFRTDLDELMTKISSGYVS